jgi:hypothetical protein
MRKHEKRKLQSFASEHLRGKLSDCVRLEVLRASQVVEKTSEMQLAFAA